MSGQTWELRCSDCLDPVTGLASLADKSVDHVICDPPYSERTHSGQMKERNDISEPLVFGYDHLTPEQVGALAREFRRISSGWVLVMTDHVLFPHWEAALPGYTFPPIPIVMRGMTVRMQGDGPSSWTVWLVVNRPTGFAEGTKPGAYTGPSGDRSATIVKGSKPEWLMEALVRDYSRAGQLICDPFAGGGTTGLAAVKLGRRFLGWEQKPEHFEFASRRLRAAREQLELVA